MTVNIATGIVTIDAKKSESGSVPLSIAKNSPRGVKTIHFTVTSQSGAVLWEGDGSVEVPPVKITVNLDDVADACPDTKVDLPFQVTNLGKCTEAITLKLTQTGGKPMAGLPPDQVINLASGGVEKGIMTVRLRRPEKGVLTFKLEVSVDGKPEGSDTATVTQAPVTVELKAEGGLTECMEGRGITFTAAAKGKCWGRLKYFTFYFQRADGTSWESRDWTYSNSVDNYSIEDQVPTGNSNHFFTTPVTARCEDTNGNVSSSGLKIKVYQLWITKFADAITGKSWKVCVGDPISHDAIASSDCKDFAWDMEDGAPDAWNPTGETTKTGTKMVIPNTDKVRASNSWFGDAYGTVTVSCKDGEGNSYVRHSTSMNPSMKAKVFFDPYTNDLGGAPTDQKPPAWFKFWKEADIVDGMAAASFQLKLKKKDYYGFAKGKSVTFGLLAVTKNDGPETLFSMSRKPFTMTGTGQYLHCLAETLAHENYHNYIFDHFTGGKQSDTDRINDAEELSPHRSYFPLSDPKNADTFGCKYAPNKNGDYSDAEVRCRIIELHGLPVIYAERDWAKDPQNPQW